MRLNVLYFAHVRERTGVASEGIDVAEGATVRAAVQAIVARHPRVGPLVASVRVAVDGEFAAPDDVLREGAEVVLIPPVAGGAGEGAAEDPGTPFRPVALVEAPMDDATLSRLVAHVSGPAHGAVATFTGVVRNHARGRDVTAIDYEAYATMAQRQLEAVAAGVEADVPGTRVAVHHRVGRLVVGDAAVMIAAGSAHRAEAFEACREVIERLKRDVPIWKREIGPDGEEWVSDRP